MYSRCFRQPENNFSGIDISQALDWEPPSLSPHFLLIIDIICDSRPGRLVQVYLFRVGSLRAEGTCFKSYHRLEISLRACPNHLFPKSLAKWKRKLINFTAIFHTNDANPKTIFHSNGNNNKRISQIFFIATNREAHHVYRRRAVIYIGKLTSLSFL